MLGLGKTSFTGNLVRIGSESNWVCLSAGADHNLALKPDGTIWAWGANYRGQLGNGFYRPKLTNGAPNIQNCPVQTVEGNDWAQIEAGSVTSYALKRDGSLWAWGLNNFCQLGIGSWTDSATAVQVGASTNWAKIRAGGVGAGGIQSDGSLWIWGGSPKLGNTAPNNAQNLLVPTRINSDTNWVDLSVAYNIWLAIKSDGTLWAWGRIAHVFTGASASADETPMQVGSDTDWQSVSSSGGGFYHLLRKRDGSFWVMDAPDFNRASSRLRRVELPSDVVASAAGGGAIAVITRNGEVWTCGTVLGEHGAKDRLLLFLEQQCWRVGWKVRWGYQPTRIMHEQPRRLRNVVPMEPAPQASQALH